MYPEDNRDGDGHYKAHEVIHKHVQDYRVSVVHYPADTDEPFHIQISRGNESFKLFYKTSKDAMEVFKHVDEYALQQLGIMVNDVVKDFKLIIEAKVMKSRGAANG